MKSVRYSRGMNRTVISHAAFLLSVIGILAAQTTSTGTNEPRKKTEPCQASALPTATEIFHLKTECMELGEKLEKNAKIPETAVTMHSRYDPKSNRCYVEFADSGPNG